MTGYAVVLPPPWKRIPVADPVAAGSAVRSFVQASVRHAPPEIAPDQRAKLLVELEGRMRRQIDQLRDGGALDYYVPDRPLKGVSLNASFVVSSVIPDATADADWVAPIHHELAGRGATTVTIADDTWSRTDEVIETDGGELVERGVPARRISYTASVPGDERRWAIVTCTAIGDGTPDSEQTGLLVQLFDAIMSTWRWVDAAP